MRTLAIAGFSAALALIVATPALAQTDGPDCPKGPGGGGMVGGVNRVTKQIPGGDCPSQAPKETEPDCTSIRLEYEPAAIPYDKLGKAVLTYDPLRCARPSGSPGFELTAGSREIFVLDSAGFVNVRSNAAATATIRATHGSLAATADISSVKRPEKCTEMKLAYDPPRIHVDDYRKPQLTFLPQDCLDAPWRGDAKFEASAPAIAWIDSVGEVHGVRLGEARITAALKSFTAATTVTIVNDGPPCTNLEMDYSPARLPLGAATRIPADRQSSPRLKYQPDNCARPQDDPNFRAITPSVVKVDSHSGVATGLQLGTARIGVEHGQLYAVAQLDVIAPPPCDYISVSYDPRRFPLHDTASPTVSYKNYKIATNDPDTCAKPDGIPTFSSEPAESLEFIWGTSNGIVKGLAIGTPAVKLEHGTLSGETMVEVVDGPPCSKLIATYDPPKIAVVARGTREMSQLRVAHEPSGCVPAYSRRVHEDTRKLDLDADGTVFGVVPFRGVVDVEEGQSGDPDYLATKAPITVTGGCMNFSAALRPQTIMVGAEALLIFTFDPEGCSLPSPPNLSWVTANKDAINATVAANGSISLLGVQSGQSTVVVKPGAIGVKESGEDIVPPAVSLLISVAAPACTGISLAYSVPKFDPKQKPPSGQNFSIAGGAARLTYAPAGCVPPAGKPQYTSDTRSFAGRPRYRCHRATPRQRELANRTYHGHAREADRRDEGGRLLVCCRLPNASGLRPAPDKRFGKAKNVDARLQAVPSHGAHPRMAPAAHSIPCKYPLSAHRPRRCGL